VLTLEDEQTVKNAFLENSFSPELLSSEDTSLSFEAQGNEYFVLSNERIISLYCSLSK
jgi:hypothetical protein